VIVVSDSSPQIALARIEILNLLPEVFPRVHIPLEVFTEVVEAGTGRPGAQQVTDASWVQVMPVRNRAELIASIEESGLGPGEVAACHHRAGRIMNIMADSG
jgi:predicted nucleic acid-binding protein